MGKYGDPGAVPSGDSRFALQFYYNLFDKSESAVAAIRFMEINKTQTFQNYFGSILSIKYSHPIQNKEIKHHV